MKRLRFLVPRAVTYASDAAAEFYGELGGGAIDFGRPLPPGRVRFWPGGALRAGHLLDGHLAGRHLDEVDADGHLEGIHLSDPHLAPLRPMVLESPSYVFGRFRHALRMLDGAGNVSEGVEFSHVINDSPRAPGGLRRVGWDEASRSVVFEFRPVRFAAAAGG